MAAVVWQKLRQSDTTSDPVALTVADESGLNWEDGSQVSAPAPQNAQAIAEIGEAVSRGLRDSGKQVIAEAPPAAGGHGPAVHVRLAIAKHHEPGVLRKLTSLTAERELAATILVHDRSGRLIAEGTWRRTHEASWVGGAMVAVSALGPMAKLRLSLADDVRRGVLELERFGWSKLQISTAQRRQRAAETIQGLVRLLMLAAFVAVLAFAILQTVVTGLLTVALIAGSIWAFVSLRRLLARVRAVGCTLAPSCEELPA